MSVLTVTNSPLTFCQPQSSVAGDESDVELLHHREVDDRARARGVAVAVLLLEDDRAGGERRGPPVVGGQRVGRGEHPDVHRS